MVLSLENPVHQDSAHKSKGLLLQSVCILMLRENCIVVIKQGISFLLTSPYNSFLISQISLDILYVVSFSVHFPNKAQIEFSTSTTKCETKMLIVLLDLGFLLCPWSLDTVLVTVGPSGVISYVGYANTLMIADEESGLLLPFYLIRCGLINFDSVQA